MSDPREMGQQAGKEARELTRRLLKRGHGPSLTKTLDMLNNLVSAYLVKTAWDREAGWQYSERLDDNRTRLQAVNIALQLHDAFPAAQTEQSGAVRVIIESNVPAPEIPEPGSRADG